MKKLILLGLSVGLFFYIEQSVFAQRGQGAGRVPPVGTAGQLRGQSHGVSADHRHSSSQGANTPQRGQQPETKITSTIERNERLSSRLQTLLPEGMTFETASAGFKNLGQFIAALHVSQNLDIPFAELQTRMTGDGHMSLGEAIGDWKSSLSEPEVTVEVNKAEEQAQADQQTIE